ncbi:MAG: hypothetical protein EOP11_07385 [Proteobacteria bacterium]|nr:MAG: hypothetical protein EOP11_07385 [Pseudomonadota bacterium]
MGKKRISIPLARFEAARPLAADVFLHLVLNQKTIRIAEIEGSLTEELLTRLRSKGYSHLEVSCEGEDNDPDTHPLYLTESDPAPGAAPTVFSAESNVDEFGKTLAAGKPEETHDGHIIQKEVSASEAPSASMIEASGTEGSEQAFEAGAAGELEAQNFAAAKVAPDAESLLANADAETLAETTFAGRSEPADDSSQTIKAGEAEEATIFKVKSGSPDEEEEDIIFELEQKLETAKETLLAGGHFDLEKEKVEILRGAKNSILAAKISDRIIELKGQPGPDDAEEITDLASSLQKAKAGRDLSEETLARFSISKELEEVETIIAADRSETERVIDLSEHLANYAKSRDEAKGLLEESGQETESPHTKRAANHRDFPQTVSRHAASLGHSLGYTHPKFLNDLAIASICHFGRKAGKTLEEDSLPSVAKLLMQAAGEDDQVIKDSRDVLTLLDAYFSDPESDKAEKDFNFKVLRRTAELVSKAESIDAWNLKCWMNYLDQGGATLETHSVCNRATASALKFMRGKESEALS